ncbi:hypothetical protein MNBD_GAMMA04-367 [hydrothermal vent metagenome]|uniref:YhdP central domain-containing protein n=1 Tax=hydrothermal vent metagenome TaxID=652676 RepID=A0A3B0WFJ1_9ZZZZ
MVIKHTHHSLQIVFAVLIGYLLITRAFISWVQYAPDSFIEQVEWVTDSQIEFEQIKVQQNWLGFQFQVEQLAVNHVKFDLDIEYLDMDMNLFSMLIPTLKFGDNLTIKKGSILDKTTQNRSQNTLDIEGFSADKLEKMTEINLDISQLWQRVKVSDLIFKGVFDPDLTLNLYRYQSLKGQQLNVVSEFGVAYKESLNFERFSFKSSFETDLLGKIEQGEFSLFSFEPLRIEALAPLLPTVWHQKLPKGELILDLKAEVLQSTLSRLTLNLNTQALKWPQEREALPKHLGFELVWEETLQNKQTFFKDWRFRLSHIQLDNQYIKTVSPIELNFLENHLLTFQSNFFDIEPFKMLMKSFLPTAYSVFLLDKKTEFSIEKVSGQFNWRMLQLPQLDATIKALSIPVTDYPGIEIQSLMVSKKANNLILKTKFPMILSGLNLPMGGVKIILPNQINLTRLVDKGWGLEPFGFTLDKMPVTMTATGNKQGEMDVDLRIKVGDMKTLKQYLPYNLLSPELQAWLKMALVSGDNIQAHLQLKGNLKDFPFQDGTGLFQITATIENTFLKFDANWPMLEDFSGKIVFTPYQLKITSPQIHVGEGNYAQAVEVVIDHLDQKNIALVFKGKVKTELNQAISYLTKSPLSALLSMEPFIQNTQFQGAVDVTLDRVWIPLYGYKNQAEKVNGRVQFNNASMTLFDKIPLKKIQGSLEFTERSATASKLSVHVFNHNSTFSVKTKSKAHSIFIQGKGQFLRQKNPFFDDSIPWRLGINIPLRQEVKSGLNLNLDVLTDQVNSLLPAPFDAKILAEKRLKVSLDVTTESLRLNASLPKTLVIKGHWTHVKDSYQMDQFNLLFGQDIQTAFKERETASYIKGEIKEVNVDDWIQFLPHLSFVQNWYSDRVQKEPDLLSWNASIIDISALTFRENVYPNVRFEWLKRNLRTALQIKSTDVLANVVIKPNSPIEMNVERLRLHAIESSEAKASLLCQPEQISASLWPEVVFKGKKIELNGYLVDSLTFHLVDAKERLTITDIQGAFGQGAGSLTGQYLFDKSTYNSKLTLSLRSKKVAEMLRFIQLKQGFTGKKAKVDANLSWQGALECFSVKNVMGQVNFVLEDGVINDIEPGFARLIGLLSVESLARRLKLDLKDVTNKGMVYDQIKGQAQLKQGILQLESFGLKAPSASVALFGQVNLLKETFKLKAYVTPAIGASIPTIAALAGYANPLAALAVYTFMKVIPGVNENLVTFRYDVTGPWSDPKVSESKSKPKTNEPLFEEEHSILDTQR